MPILGVYLVLAFYGIDRQSLWEDEYLSLRRVASPIPIWKDGHGFLYFALLKLWVGLGTSELVLRSLSIFLGAIAVCIIYAMGIASLGRRAALVGAVLFATSPFVIWYSQETRYITLVLLTTLMSMYSFHRLLTRPSSGWWLAYGTATLAALFSFVPTLLVLVAQGLYLIGSSSHRSLLLRQWLVCQLLVLILFGAWFVNGTHFLPAFIEARGSGQNIISNPKVFPFTADFNEVRLAVLPYTFFAFSAGFSLGPSPREIFVDRSLAPLRPYAFVLVLLGLLYGGLLLFGILGRGYNRASSLFLFLWMIVPVLGVFGIAALLNFYYDIRYAAMAFPAYILLLAAGIVKLNKRGAQILFLGAVLTVHCTALANYYFDSRYAREDTRAAAQYLKEAAGPRDLFLIVGSPSSLPHYYKGSVPLVDFRSLQRAGQPLKDKLRSLTANRDRIWLVQIRPWQVDRTGSVKAALDSAYVVSDRKHFPGVDVYAYRNLRS